MAIREQGMGTQDQWRRALERADAAETRVYRLIGIPDAWIATSKSEPGSAWLMIVADGTAVHAGDPCPGTQHGHVCTHVAATALAAGLLEQDSIEAAANAVEEALSGSRTGRATFTFNLPNNGITGPTPYVGPLNPPDDGIEEIVVSCANCDRPLDDCTCRPLANTGRQGRRSLFGEEG
jgi:acetylornithine deacetylase/succinyl-diaminopimelate desuccinylase-like protein